MTIIISIPLDAKCLLTPGQKVDLETPFIEKQATSDVTVNVAKKLHVEPSKIFNYLKKLVGDTVQKGEVLAEKKGFIESKKLLSDYNGIIKEVNHYEGGVMISSFKKETNHIRCYFKGEVIEIKGNLIKLHVDVSHSFDIKLASVNFGGETFYFKDTKTLLTDAQVTKKFLLVESLSVYNQKKAEALGARGFITLKSLQEKTALPVAQIKNIDDFKKILHLNFPYCLVDKQYSKIYVYK